MHECFIRQWHPAGEECQFDWGEVKLCIAGRWMKLRMAAFALPHSNHRRGYLFIREHTLAFQEAHRNYFHDIGHIPVRMVYDNMRVAVKSFVGSEKLPTDALLDLSNFYGLEWRFCNARRGNEKGTVVAAHEKTADGLWKLTLEHYLTTLSHKPGAVRNAEALKGLCRAAALRQGEGQDLRGCGGGIRQATQKPREPRHPGADEVGTAAGGIQVGRHHRDDTAGRGDDCQEGGGRADADRTADG